MNNTIKGISLFFAIAITILVLIDISSNGVVKSEAIDLATEAAYEPLNLKNNGEYDIESNDDLVAEIIRTIALNKKTDSDIKVQILGIDAKNGFVDINIIETTKHANGKKSKTEERRTVIVETQKTTDEDSK